MNKVLAIAVLSLRSAVRSKVVLVLLGLLLLAIVGLPLTVEGDGTPDGYVRVFLTYTLGAVQIILSLATLWAGCAAVAEDISGRQIQMLLTKPVSLYQVWLGKWLGLVLLNAILLGAGGALVFALLHWNLDRSDLTPEQRNTLREQVLVALAPHAPARPDVETEAQALLPELMASVPGPTGLSDRELFRQVRQMLWRRAFTIGPGVALDFEFSLPAGLPAGRPLYLDYQFATSDPTPTRIPHTWRIRRAGSDASATLSHELVGGVRHRVALDPGPLAGSGPVLLQFRNQFEGPVSVLFEPDGGLILYSVAGGFAGNLARALLILLVQLALLAAVGVTAGSLFSLPVAGFVAIFVIILLLLSPYVRGLAEREVFLAFTDSPSRVSVAVDHVLSLLFRTLHHALAPLREVQPLDDLGVGRCIAWRAVGQVFAVQLLLYGALIGALGSLLFARREVGAAS